MKCCMACGHILKQYRICVKMKKICFIKTEKNMIFRNYFIKLTAILYFLYLRFRVLGKGDHHMPVIFVQFKSAIFLLQNMSSDRAPHASILFFPHLFTLSLNVPYLMNTTVLNLKSRQQK